MASSSLYAESESRLTENTQNDSHNHERETKRKRKPESIVSKLTVYIRSINPTSHLGKRIRNLLIKCLPKDDGIIAVIEAVRRDLNGYKSISSKTWEELKNDCRILSMTISMRLAENIECFCSKLESAIMS